MRISDWSSDVCSSDLVALWCGQVCTRDGAEGTMGDMAIFRKGDRRRVGRLGLRGRRGSAVCGCGLNRGRGGGSRFAGGVAPDPAQKRLGVPAQFYLQRITPQRLLSDDLRTPPLETPKRKAPGREN